MSTTVNNFTKLIDLNTLEYPKYLSDVQAANPLASFASTPSEEMVVSLGFAVPKPTPQPEGDVVTEGQPVLDGEGYFVQTWEVRSFNQEELAAQLATRKSSLREQITYFTRTQLAKGFLHVFPDGTAGRVQLRDGDRANLVGLRITADLVLTQPDDPPTVFKFRSQENVTFNMNAAQVVAMSQSALLKYNKLLNMVWDLKDLTDMAETVADLPAVPTECPDFETA